MHELRNALSSATVAHEMIKQGLVGVGGSTSKVLEENLDRMRRLIDRALSEVRLRTDPEIQVEKFVFNTLIDQILLTSRRDANSKDQTLISEMPGGIELQTDRQLMLTAIANLVQNAIKYSKQGSTITLTTDLVDNDLIFKIADACGGIKPTILKNIFTPFFSGEDKSGLGMGLSIVQRSVSMIQGKMSLENEPGVGCKFVLQIPQSIPIVRKSLVSGKDSIHPGS